MSKNIALIAIVAVIVGLGGIYFVKETSNEPLEKDFRRDRMSDTSDSMMDTSMGGKNRGSGYGEGMGMGQGNSRGDCLADGCLAVDDLDYPVGDLPEEVIVALKRALEDEYKAYATYDAVISEYGNTRPFIMIMRAEEQHISSLKAIFDKYGLEIPENSYIDTIQAPASLADACSTGVEAEIANANLYKNELLPAVSDYEDITLVFENLMNASQQKHLPAFQRCSN